MLTAIVLTGANDIVTYTITVKNNGNLVLTNTGVSCVTPLLTEMVEQFPLQTVLLLYPRAQALLRALYTFNETATYTASYTIQQAIGRLIQVV
jgi:uncharacterized repeat protein (TIGR01451 family)